MARETSSTRPKWVTVSGQFAEKLFDSVNSSLGTGFINPVYAVAIARIHRDGNFWIEKRTVVDTLDTILPNSQAASLRQYLSTARRQCQASNQFVSEITGRDDLHIGTLRPNARVIRRSGLFANTESDPAKNSTVFVHINALFADESEMDTVPIIEHFLEIELNEEYSAIAMGDIVEAIETNEASGTVPDPVTDLDDLLLFAKDTLPDIDTVVWEYRDEFDALEAQATSLNNFIFDVFDEDNPIWNCYNDCCVVNSTNLSKSFTPKDAHAASDVGDFRSAISLLKWKSGVFYPLNIGGVCRGVVGFMAGYYGGIGEHYHSFFSLVRIHISRAIVERDQLVKDSEINKKLKSLMPALAVAREVNQRMHDVRDKLNAIKNHLWKIRNVSKYPDRDKASRFAQDGLQIIDSVNNTLSKQLQTFKRSREQRRKTEIKDYTEKLIEDLSIEHLYDAVEFSVRLPDNPCFARLQRFYFERAIENVLSNAAYFARHNQLSNHYRVEFSVEATESSICFRVQDSGPGIQQSPIEKIFEEGESTKAEGFGIGLAITRSIVEEHGGTIDATNVSKGGARFDIRIPRMD